MRQTTSMEWSIDWRKRSVKNFLTNKMSSDERRAVTIFSSFNPNGYIREQAVKMLSSYERTMPYIVLRLNDWVRQVRLTALMSIGDKIYTADDEELLRSLPYIEKLRRSDCGSNEEYIRPLFEALNSPSRRNALIAGLKSSEILTRRVCVNALLASEKPDSAALIAHLEHEPDPFLRRFIFQKLDALGVDMMDISIRFLKDKHPINRAVALQYLYDHNIKKASAEAVKLVLSKNTYVRSFARKMLKETGNDLDVRKIYLENLEKNTLAAISGLGEVGDTADCTIIEPYLRSDRKAVVRAAMVSLMKLDARCYSAMAHDMLTHPKAGIVKTAKLLIEKYRVYDYPRILEIFKTTDKQITQIKCAALLYCESKWQRLINMLYVLDSEFEDVRQLAACSIDRWLSFINTSYDQAADEQKKTITALVRKQCQKLEKQIVDRLLFLSK